MNKVALAVLVSLAARALAVEPGARAHDFDLPALAGGARVTLKELAGRVVVVDFWASWCEPCKLELPELEKLARHYASRGVVFVGINIDEHRENGARLADALGLDFPLASDPRQLTVQNYDPPKMPSSFVIDDKGVVRFVNAGFAGARDVATLRREIDQLLSTR